MNMNHCLLFSCFLICTLWCNPIQPLCSDKNPISSSSTTPRKPSIKVGIKSSWFCLTKSIDNAAVTENSEITFPHVTSDLNKIRPKVVRRTAEFSAVSKLLLSDEVVSCLATFVNVLRCIDSSTVAAYWCIYENIYSMRLFSNIHSINHSHFSPLSMQRKLLWCPSRLTYSVAFFAVQSFSCAWVLQTFSTEIVCRVLQEILLAIWEYLLKAHESSPSQLIIFSHDLIRDHSHYSNVELCDWWRLSRLTAASNGMSPENWVFAFPVLTMLVLLETSTTF